MDYTKWLIRGKKGPFKPPLSLLDNAHKLVIIGDFACGVSLD
jgi:hypothetical protein